MASTPPVRMCDLPNEVLISIFSFLPVADLAWCAAVCERWHDVVTGFGNLWEGKSYSSSRSPRECAETRAVLCALPPLREVTVDSPDSSRLYISYPRIVLPVEYLRIIEDFQRLRYECLSTSLDIAVDILSCRSPIDLDRLQHLRVLPRRGFRYWVSRDCIADHVVGAFLTVCPSLRQLSTIAEFLLMDKRNTVEELFQFLTLDMACLQKISFLRVVMDSDPVQLEELQVVGMMGLPSRELDELPRLRNLQSLRLSYCQFQDDDLAASVSGLTNLKWLQLNCCSTIRDLSMLQRCGRLQELCITNYPELNALGTPALLAGKSKYWSMRVWVTLRRDLRHVDGVKVTENILSRALSSLQHMGVSMGCLKYLRREYAVKVSADSLPAALSRLQEMGVSSACLAYLAALRNCLQLRHICCEVTGGVDEPELFPERVHINLTCST